MQAQARETLGRLVRETWVEHCRAIGDDKPSHVAPWEELGEDDQEADCLIGERVAMRIGRMFFVSFAHDPVEETSINDLIVAIIAANL